MVIARLLSWAATDIIACHSEVELIIDSSHPCEVVTRSSESPDDVSKVCSGCFQLVIFLDDQVD